VASAASSASIPATTSPSPPWNQRNSPRRRDVGDQAAELGALPEIQYVQISRTAAMMAQQPHPTARSGPPNTPTSPPRTRRAARLSRRAPQTTPLHLSRPRTCQQERIVAENETWAALVPSGRLALRATPLPKQNVARIEDLTPSTRRPRRHPQAGHQRLQPRFRYALPYSMASSRARRPTAHPEWLSICTSTHRFSAPPPCASSWSASNSSAPSARHHSRIGRSHSARRHRHLQPGASMNVLVTAAPATSAGPSRPSSCSGP